MTKGRAQVRKERIESWFSDLLGEFEYSITAEDLKQVRTHRIEKRESTYKFSSYIPSISDKPVQIGSEQPVILVTNYLSANEDEPFETSNQIYDRLVEDVLAEELPIKIERTDDIVDEESVKKIGKQSKASVVIWGCRDADSYQLCMDILKNLSMAFDQSPSTSIMPPKRVKFKPVASLDPVVQYLAKLFIGTCYFCNGDPQKAGLFFEDALEVLPDACSTNIGADESLLFRVIWSYS